MGSARLEPTTSGSGWHDIDKERETMKKILLASVALFGFAGAAAAADLLMRAAPPAPIIAAAPIFTWTGFYVGVNAGFGWSDDDFDSVDLADDDNDGGFVGGAQVGYNYQIGSFVVGLEGDIQYADFGREGAFVVDGTTYDV